MFDNDGGDGNGAGGTQPTDGANKAPVDEPGSDLTKTGGDKTDEGIPKTKEELDKLIQSAGDSRITDYLKGDKFKTRITEIILEDRKEQERIAGLSQKQRDEESDRKRKEELDARDKELKEKERIILIQDKMRELRVPIEVADVYNSVTAGDEVGIVEQINKFVRIFEAGKTAAKQELLQNKGTDRIPGKQTPGGDDPEASIQAEYNNLMAKPNLNPHEQRKLSELAVKLKAAKEMKK